MEEVKKKKKIDYVNQSRPPLTTLAQRGEDELRTAMKVGKYNQANTKAITEEGKGEEENRRREAEATSPRRPHLA